MPTYAWQTKKGNTALNPGEVVKLSAAGAVDAVIVADTDGTTSQIILGVVKSKDTVTATATGTVDVYIPLPGVIYAALADVAANFNTQGKINSLIGNRVKFTVTSGAITVDVDEADATANGVRIVGGDPTRSLVYFMLETYVTFLGNITT